MQIANYKSFTRNRCDGQIMGGISTSVCDMEKDYVVQTKVGDEKDEFLVTRHSNFQKPINVINIYGEQEGRETVSNVESRWSRILNEIIHIKNRKESCIIIGDLNKHIGNDLYGVKGNHQKISPGGELVRALLYDGQYICLNNHETSKGGPFTRYDPAAPHDKTKMSCLDLVIISQDLFPYVKSIEIDSTMKFSPSRVVNRKTTKYPDHFPVIIVFENIPRRRMLKNVQSSYITWNKNKEDGWEKYKSLTESNEAFTGLIDNENPATTDDMSKIESKLTKIKFSAFGKVKKKQKKQDKVLNNLYRNKAANFDDPVKLKSIDEKINNQIFEAQKVEFENEVQRVLLMKKCKGKTAAVFDAFKKFGGDNKVGQEQTPMLDPDSNLMLYDPASIKKASLKYCKDLLNVRPVHDEFEIDYLIQDLIHFVRADNANDDMNDVLNFSDFENRLKLVQKKGKSKYDFILKSGEAYKRIIFELFDKIWTTEMKPQQWRNTMIVQIHKGKGDLCSFDSQRNIHTKLDLPKLFEGIVVDRSKEKIIQKCSKFQIGGIPGHRPQEHLFTAKSIISLYSFLDTPLFLQLYDLSKYFDKEILRDAMDTLYNAGINGKLYRLWFMMNKDTQIRVKTSFGITDVAPTGENVAQGSIGGGLISALNLCKSMTAYFTGSDSEVSYGSTRLSPILYQDDSARFCTGFEEAQKGNILISYAMKAKQLELNVDKCATILFGRGKRIQEMKEFIENNKILTIDGIEVKMKQEEKYLGDYIHSLGLSKSVESTVNKRYGKCLTQIMEIKSVIEEFRMHSLGAISSGLTIFNMAVLPFLLYNASTWFETSTKTINRLENLQHILQRCLLCVPNSTPIAAMCWDLGTVSIQHQINEAKLMFLHYVNGLDESTLAKEIYESQKSLNFPGLVVEARELLLLYGLPNIIDQKISQSKQSWRKLVKNAIRRRYEDELKSQFNGSKLKNGPFKTESFEMKEYLQEMNLSDSRTHFRRRSNMLNVKMNQKNNPVFANKLWKCEACFNLDSQSHLMWCPAFASLREGLNIDNDLDVVHYIQNVFKIRENMNSSD